MEYNKLIKNEIYTRLNGNIVRYENLNSYNKVCGIHIGGYHNCLNHNDGNFEVRELKLATLEEKHWLNTCIEQDKFITFEEAMKTFIPEYVEWIDNIGSGNLGYQTKDHFKKNKIFKTDVELPSHGFQTQNWIIHLEIYANNYKPSTKEAYDAQFVVKEPEFVLPEKWCILIDNYNKEILEQERLTRCIINNAITCLISINKWLVSDSWRDGTCISYTHCLPLKGIYVEITFEQFKKYVLKEEIVKEKVIEPLPQFKVIESIETITKVENNEGNQFFIGDVVKSSNGTIQTIESFDYNKAKTNIIAFTNKQSILGNGIGIDKIEHYIEPKVEVKDEFILPEKWFIKTTEETFDIIRNWANKMQNFNIYDIYVHHCNVNFNYEGKYRRNDNCAEITFDQFKKYVLKEEVKTITLPPHETLLEKAKRLYPIGTKVKTATNNNLYVSR